MNVFLSSPPQPFHNEQPNVWPQKLLDVSRPCGITDNDRAVVEHDRTLGTDGDIQNCDCNSQVLFGNAPNRKFCAGIEMRGTSRAIVAPSQTTTDFDFL